VGATAHRRTQDALSTATELLSVLVVEDNPADADLVREMLLDADPVAAGAVAPSVHHVETLRAGLRAAEGAAEGAFDVVLLDLGLPDASGFEALDAFALRAPQLPSVVLTGARDPALGARALVAGAQDFLVKGEVGGELLLRSLRFAVARQQHGVDLRRVMAEQAARAAAEASHATSQALAEENERLFLSAQEAVRAREEFISIASHELRSPLSALQLSIAMLAETVGPGADAATARRLEAASSSVERLTRLVNTLLDLSRAAAAGPGLVREAVDLRRVALDALEQLRGAAGAAGCELRLDAPFPVVGEWDRTAIERIVVNLVDNAVKYAPGKPVEVRVAERGDACVVSVRDHGPGIAPADASRIFERFARAARGRRRAEGLGLGLYIARRLAEGHGGRIELESEAGAGATFRVLLPRSAPPAELHARP
jgi:signal transduction histidine kinase